MALTSTQRRERRKDAIDRLIDIAFGDADIDRNALQAICLMIRPSLVKPTSLLSRFQQLVTDAGKDGISSQDLWVELQMDRYTGRKMIRRSVNKAETPDHRMWILHDEDKDVYRLVSIGRKPEWTDGPYPGYMPKDL